MVNKNVILAQKQNNGQRKRFLMTNELKPVSTSYFAVCLILILKKL